ncbi:unnamed protein product [marine sediment metagenome]|uniref:Uncharacterized protein n=1 Tax=marine sediment metagenome TaxID=412755 RepID=X1A3F3_9ZZZZ
MAEYLSCVFIDSKGRHTNRRYEVETQTLKADYGTLATAFAAEIEAITDLGLVSVTLLRPLGVSFAVTAGANVDVGATFNGLVYDGEGKQASLKMPGFKDALVDDDASIDLDDADVAAFLDRFLQAAGDFLLSDGEQMASWTRGTLDR